MKDKIRKLYKAKRAQMTVAEVAKKSLEASKAFLSGEQYKNCKTLMLYMPLGNETDTTYIIKKAFEDGKKVAFPVTEVSTGIITPYYADENTTFAKGDFSVSEPQNAQPADVADIDVVVVPGIAFDKNGARIGFGKGCYDGFLAKTHAAKVGFCYALQVCDQIPADAHDVYMDYLVTEKGIFDCKNCKSSSKRDW